VGAMPFAHGFVRPSSSRDEVAMDVRFSIPDEVARRLERQWPDLTRRALEALAISAYRDGALTEAEVQQVLGLSSRWEVDALLKANGAWIDDAEADLDRDLEDIRGLPSPWGPFPTRPRCVTCVSSMHSICCPPSSDPLWYPLPLLKN